MLNLLKKSIFGSLALICLYFASQYLLIGSGYFPEPTFMDILLLGLLIIFFNSSKKIFYFVLLPFALIQAFYLPVGMLFGPPSYQYVASVFATDLMESREFIRQLPIKYYGLSLSVILLLLAFRFLTQKAALHFYKNKVFLAVAATLMLIGNSPLKFIQEGGDSLLKVKEELSRLNNLTIESQWGNSELINSKYDDYVLIIGESARKDYHHAYGYPLENTPFMSKANGVLIDGLTAGGTNTIASLKLMLTQPDTQNWEGNYALNLVDLIKSADVKTYWLSNQGYLGDFDTPIAALANKSDEKIFLKKGDSFSSKNISDFELLPKFHALLNQPSKSKRFIVLHLYGSHPITCDRLEDYPKILADDIVPKKYFNVNCYASSIKKTDEVIKQVYEALSQNKAKTDRTFSMIYFSDHGLSHFEDERGVHIVNTHGKSKRHFDIPLFKISSDDNERKEYKAFKSGLNFTNGIANWIGIQNPKIPQYDLFSPAADSEDYGLQKIISEITAPEDPAVIIPTK